MMQTQLQSLLVIVVLLGLLHVLKNKKISLGGSVRTMNMFSYFIVFVLFLVNLAIRSSLVMLTFNQAFPSISAKFMNKENLHQLTFGESILAVIFADMLIS